MVVSGFEESVLALESFFFFFGVFFLGGLADFAFLPEDACESAAGEAAAGPAAAGFAASGVPAAGGAAAFAPTLAAAGVEVEPASGVPPAAPF